MMTHIADAIIFILGIVTGWACGVEGHKEKNSKIMSELEAGLKQLRILAGDDAEGDRARLRLACSRRLAHVQGSGDARDAWIMGRIARWPQLSRSENAHMEHIWRAFWGIDPNPVN